MVLVFGSPRTNSIKNIAGSCGTIMHDKAVLGCDQSYVVSASPICDGVQAWHPKRVSVFHVFQIIAFATKYLYSRSISSGNSLVVEQPAQTTLTHSIMRAPLALTCGRRIQ
jgi:hypothetical protein